jgi:NTE family protein
VTVFADLVLEGGGVKGIALVGVFSVLEQRGYQLRRVAGTSAGAIVGSLVAANARAAEVEETGRACRG